MTDRHNKWLTTILLLLAFSNPMPAQDHCPDSALLYRETFRGQFHFSPRHGWMNDINGLVYQGGKYHMTYQWGKDLPGVRHGGYATSPDLVHWTDHGPTLIPQKSDLPQSFVRNVSGEHVFSGSAVVVSGKVARKITGSDAEAIVAIYTGTGLGTCLAWSNDSGNSWHDYKGNPVANPTCDYNPRDPSVFYHAPTRQWVLAIYENGTTFYGSKDLIHCSFLSNINFGFECPDLFELPLDGDDSRKKWILTDANGSYIVGDFDGTVFTPSGQGVLTMACGPDFYAAQTFPTGGLPGGDPRKIQIAWMDHWNGGIGERAWERNATFPVSLNLVTYEGKMRLTRNPIREIALLYKNTHEWGAQTILPGNELFKDIRSKTFELIAEFDLSKSSAGSFGIQVANKKIAYHTRSQVLLDEPLAPDPEGHLKLHILVDWGQLEVFANNGLFSYAEEFAFSPDNEGHIHFFTDGEIHLLSMTLNELSSIWE